MACFCSAATSQRRALHSTPPSPDVAAILWRCRNTRARIWRSGERRRTLPLSTECPPGVSLRAAGSSLSLSLCWRRGRLGWAGRPALSQNGCFFVPHRSGAAGSGCGVQRPPCAGRAAIGCARRAGPRERRRRPRAPPASAAAPGVGSALSFQRACVSMLPAIFRWDLKRSTAIFAAGFFF